MMFPSLWWGGVRGGVNLRDPSEQVETFTPTLPSPIKGEDSLGLHT
jgi:hypothetical protein